MRVKILIGAESAYACINTSFVKLDVKLEPGRAAWVSLRESAEDMRQQAARLQQRAMLMEEAAYQLEDDERNNRLQGNRHG